MHIEINVDWYAFNPIKFSLRQNTLVVKGKLSFSTENFIMPENNPALLQLYVLLS